MSVLLDPLSDLTAEIGAGRSTGRDAPAPSGRSTPVLPGWLRAQSVNLSRHASALRPFQQHEFGCGASAPTEAHIQAANKLILTHRQRLFKMANRLAAVSSQAQQEPNSARLQQAVTLKEQAHHWVQSVEKIWDFYFELFGQRQSPYGDWLLSCDRIALDCYQAAYMGVGVAKSIPTPPPFSYMRTGFSPATFRRGIPLSKLGQRLNPFPLIQLPYHRLVNPWTLGAVLHEVSHNLQNDLGLGHVVPRRIARRLLDQGAGMKVAGIWTRWNRETFADMSGLLLGGPAVVSSLMDVVGRSPEATLHYNPRGPHPTPYIRTFLSIELLRRMGFSREAEEYRRAWTMLYPDPHAGSIPASLLKDLPEVVALVVDTICFQPYQELGNKNLAQVYCFQAKEQAMSEEAAQRLATGTDPGIIPERFLISAARIAFDRRIATPDAITKSFYLELARR